MITTLLFDLDGTLIDLDRRGLTLEFLGMVYPIFKGLVPFWRLYPVTKAIIKYTKTHGTHMTNFEAMVAAICSETGATPEEAIRRIRQFEANFERLAWRFTPVANARETLEMAHSLGFRLAIATNPSTPASLVKYRLEWAGIAHLPYVFVTHSEVMSRCKPSMSYYEEMRDKWGIKPDSCLMIGNEADMDLPATALGIRTFLVERGRAGWLHSANWNPNYTGSFRDLQALLQQWAAARPSPSPDSSDASI